MHKPSNPSQKRGQKPLDVSTVNVSFKPQGNLTCTRSIFNDLFPLHQVRFRDGWTFKCPFVLLSYLFLNRTRVALLTAQFSLNPSKGRKGLNTQFNTLSIISLPYNWLPSLSVKGLLVLQFRAINDLQSVKGHNA